LTPTIPIQLGATDFDRRPQTPIGGPTDFLFYSHGENPLPVKVLTNGNVFELKPSFGYFETETCCDWVQIVDNLGGFQYRGSLNPTTSPVPASCRARQLMSV